MDAQHHNAHAHEGDLMDILLWGWSKVTHEIATHRYMVNDKDVAAIFPKETRDGKIAWGYFIKTLS